MTAPRIEYLPGPERDYKNYVLRMVWVDNGVSCFDAVEATREGCRTVLADGFTLARRVIDEREARQARNTERPAGR